MYHGIVSASSPAPGARETGADFYDVPLEHFKAQMDWLKKEGYKVTTIDTPSVHGKGVVITFDDGELNNFQNALPVLQEKGWKAYFFIIVKRIGEQGYMNWQQLKAMADAGMIIGSHGLTHEILTNLLDSQMEEELRASKSTLEINLNISVTSLSIPRGFCNDKVLQTAYALGYKTIFISDRPLHVKSSCFTRVAVKAGWSLKRFQAAMEGRVPVMEQCGEFFKKVLKTVFRESGYNWIRNLLIRIIK